ncbi:unnamed protein product [Aphanomyces euteiches]
MITTITAFLFALTSTANGHGALFNPLPTFKPNIDITQYCGTIDGPIVLPGDQYNTSPEANTNAFTTHFKASSYKTLKDFVVANPSTCGACGITLEDGTPRDLPANGEIYWRHDPSEGFVASHEGPCEVWCDSKRVFQNDNCARNVKNGTMVINPSDCKGASRLSVYWLALHSPQWQTYINCVQLTGGAPSPPSSSPTTAPSNKPTSAPRPTPSTSPYTYPPSNRPSTSAPSKSPSTSVPSMSPSTSAPSRSPSTSAPTKSPSTPRPSTNPITSRPATPSPSSNGQVQGYQQCGGLSYKGATQCVSGFHCNTWNEWYSQCVPN